MEELPETQAEFSEEDFEGLSKAEKIDLMRGWFYDNYEDPAERTPYESAEGGYIYIWGGPYYALDELSFFEEFVGHELVQELADELNQESFEWTGTESPEGYEESYLSFIGSEDESFASFVRTIDHVRKISEIPSDGEVKNHLLGMLYVNVITAMETYLSDVFLREVIEDKTKLVKFVENNPGFQNRTFKLSEIFREIEAIEDEAKKFLLGMMWHNLNKIKPMFKVSLNVDFPRNISVIFKAVLKRHDLVHRGGKNKDGEVVQVTALELKGLVETVCEFIEGINDQLVAQSQPEF